MNNKEYFIFVVVAPILSCWIGIWFGATYLVNDIGGKEYPIEVETSYTIGYNYYSQTMECDSIKGDTLWKDGNKIVGKNIINVVFK